MTPTEKSQNSWFFLNVWRRVLVFEWGVLGRDCVRSDFVNARADVRSRTFTAACPMCCALRIGLDEGRLGCDLRRRA